MVDNACIKNVYSSFLFVAMLRYSIDNNTCQLDVYATQHLPNFNLLSSCASCDMLLWNVEADMKVEGAWDRK